MMKRGTMLYAEYDIITPGIQICKLELDCHDIIDGQGGLKVFAHLLGPITGQ